MKLIFALLFGVMIASPMAMAQTPAAGKSKGVRRVARKAPVFHRAGLSAIFGQERIDATKGAEKTTLESQLDGIQVHYNYNIPFQRTAWRHSYEAALALGRLKTKGNTVNIADELKDQPWMSLTLTPMLMARTTQVSEFGFGVPLVYRIIQWKLKGGGLDMEKDQSYSAGVSAIYLNNFSPRNSLRVSLTYQHMWETTLWNLGWEFRL